MGNRVIKDHLSKKGTLGDLRDEVAALQYADDTQLYVSPKDERTLSLSDCFKKIHWWFTLHGLSLNPEISLRPLSSAVRSIVS